MTDARDQVTPATPRLRVLEFSDDSLAASFAGYLLGGLGHDVIKAERPGTGDRLRNRPPAVPETGRSLPFLYTARGKRWVSLPVGPAGDTRLRELAESADLLICGGAGLPECRARGATIVISPFGLTGQRAGWLADATGVFHAGGVGYVTPRSAQAGAAGEIEPQAPAGYLTEYFCGLYAAMLGLAFGAGRDSRLVDLSMQDCLLPLTRREVGAWLAEHRLASRNDRLWQVGPSDFFPTADGEAYVSVVEDAQWRRLAQLCGAAGPLPDTVATSRSRFDHPDDVERIIGPWLRGHRSAEVFELCGAAGVPVGPAFGPAELLAQPELRDDNVLTVADVRDGGARYQVTLPASLPAQLQAAAPGTGQAGAARLDYPEPGQDTSAILAELHPARPGQPPAADQARAADRAGALGQAGEVSQPAAAAGNARLPLHGWRFVEFTHVWAGPLCGQFLADLGAEVIKVESRRYLDVHRRAGPYVGGIADINHAAVWRAQNRGKLSCTLDLKSDRGRELALQLAGTADVVIENFRPGTLARLGLSFAALREVRPDIVLVSLSGYGQAGHRSQFPAYGPMMDAVTGLSWLTRSKTGRPQSVNGWFPDVAGALYGAICAIAAARRARATGQGAHIDVAEMQSLISLLPEMFATADAGGVNARDVDPDGAGLGTAGPGSASPGTVGTDWMRANLAPGGRETVLLRCRGEDNWAAVAAGGTDRRQTLQRTVQVASRLPADSRPADTAAPGAAHTVAAQTAEAVPGGIDLDNAALTGRLRQIARLLDREELCAALQDAGIAAVPVLSAKDLVEDEHLRLRRAFRGEPGRPPDETVMYAPAWLVDGQRLGAQTPAPDLGRDNDYVLGTLLRLAPGQIEELRAQEVLT